MIISIIDITHLKNYFYNNFDQLLNLFPEYRKEKITALKNENDKLRSAAAGLLLNYSLNLFFKDSDFRENIFEENNLEDNNLEDNFFRSEIVIVNVNDAILQYNKDFNVPISKEKNGRPFFNISDFPKKYDIIPFFNLSHSGKYAVCIIDNKRCGIDIEEPHPFKGSVVNRFFSKTEADWIYCASNQDEMQSRFLRLWTLKESYSKYTGNGIVYDINKIHFFPQKNKDNTYSIIPDYSFIPTSEKNFSIAEYIYDSCFISITYELSIV